MKLAALVLFTFGLNVVAEIREISVSYNLKSKSFEVLNGIDKSADAYGYFNKNFNSSGWNHLDVYMNEKVNSVGEHLRYSKAMGFVEGYVTCQDIKIFWSNFYSAMYGTELPGEKTLAFLKENYAWMNEMALKNAATDDYWATVQATLSQLNGVFEGFVAGCGSDNYAPRGSNIWDNLDHPTLEHFIMINAWGDLYQIASAYTEPGMNSRLQGNKKFMQSSIKTRLEANNDIKEVQRCSAIVKILPGNADVLYGHGTWDSFESLGPRILKHYNHMLMRDSIAVQAYDIYFSSSPAVLSSIDDFFTMSGFAELGVQETTNNLYNDTLLELLTPASVLSWQRALASHQLATSGADWGTHFSRYHSGTYTNQWMVLDLKLFTPGSPPQANFFTVLEEVPGLIHVEDQTEALIRDTYWGSYNIPFYQDISIASGYAALCKLDATRCHDTAPRANLFREYNSQITSLEKGQWMLDYNNWAVDAASLNSSCNAVACRGDLEPIVRQRGAFGALDGKIASATGSKRAAGSAPPALFARLGPTSAEQPVFCWSQLEDEADYSHHGQPDCYDFPWVQFPPISTSLTL